MSAGTERQNIIILLLEIAVSLLEYINGNQKFL
jgi:hypothetical protein